MALWDVIKKRREMLRITQKELANMAGCTATHISEMEKPYAISRRTASDELLRKLAKILSTSEADRAELEKILLIEKAKLAVSPEICRLLEEKILVKDFSPMPEEFIKRLKKDIENAHQTGSKDVFKVISPETLTKIISGNQSLTRKGVIELARALNQDVEEYLIDSGYLPDNLKDFLEHGGSSTMLRSIRELSTEDVDALIDIFNNIIEQYKKKYNLPNQKEEKGGA